MWFERFLEEDIGFGDITSDLLLSDEEAIGTIFTKEDCILAGLEEIDEIFRYHGIKTLTLASDGDPLKKGDSVIELRGNARAILMLERTAINLLSHMSGVATYAKNMVELARETNPEVIVAVTRKTTPGLRMIEKKAANIGGADTHRLRLDDHILIKDNHIAAVGGISEAVNRAKKASFVRKIEIECETIEDSVEAAEAGADIIMLDNMSPEEAKKAYDFIKARYPLCLIEISGGINEGNIKHYAPAANIISVGAITHSAKSIDFSLEIEGIME